MEAFLIYLFKTSGILSIFYMVYHFLLRKDTFFTVHRHFLIIGMITSLLLPFIEFTSIKFIQTPTQYMSEAPVSLISQSSLGETIDWWSIGFIFYCIGVIVFSIHFGMQLVSLRKLMGQNHQEKKEGLRILKVSEDVAPFSYFTSIIYNPSLHSDEELAMILAHEKIHVKQQHTIDLLLVNIFMIFQWINPIVWSYKKSLTQNLEFIADRETVQEVQSKKEYQLTLVKVSSGNYSALANNFYQSLIKKRIVMLNKQASKKKNLWKLVIILPMLSLFLWGFNTREITKVNPAVPTMESKILLNENNFSVKAKKNTIEFTINKKSSSEDLERIKRILKKEYQVDIKFKEIKRNSANEIIGISVDISSKKNNANYAVEDTDPITPFVISYNGKDNKINIRQHNDHSFRVLADGGKKSFKRKKVIELHRDHDEDEDFKLIFIGDDENSKVIKKKIKGGKITIEKNHGHSDTVFGIHTDDDKTFAFISNGPDKAPLIIIDGKEASKKEIKALDSHNIESMNVLKGKKAIKKYGKKAENGVIEIITKKK